MAERVLSEVVELLVDRCENVYGVSPCTAGRIHTGTAQAGSARTVTLAAGASAVDDFYVPMTARIVSGTGAGQERRLKDYVGATKVATIADLEPDFSPAADGTSVVHIIDRPNACYNVFAGKSPCQDKANYVKGSRTIRLTGVGAPIDKTAPARPYLTRMTISPTELDPEQGLAQLGSWSAQATDDNAKDVEDDPYVRDRVTVAGSTWWRRFIARNPNYFGRQALVKRGFYDGGVFDVGLPATYLSLPGTSGNYASTPDSAASSVTGDIDIRVKAALNDWTPFAFGAFVAKMTGDAIDGWSYRLGIHVDGSLRFSWNSAGTFLEKDSTVVAGIADGAVKWVRAILDVDNGAAGNDVKFYTSDDGAIWTQLGATVTTAGVTSVADSIAALEVGSRRDGTADILTSGKAFYAELRNGIDGTVVAAFDPSRANGGDKALTAETGEVWTINQSGQTPARLVSPAITERAIIDSVKGPNGRGEVTLSMKDPSRLLDRATVPKVTAGKLITELKAVENSGVVIAATTTTIRLAATASAVDDAYNGMEVLITFNAGAGQRRVITDYTGATRECTVAAWLVLPDTASQYEVSGLKIQMGTGQGAQYDDPATSGKREFVRLGDEVIEYTAKSADTLTFPDSTYRAQFGSTRSDSSVDDAVILCRAWFDKLATDVVKEILLATGYVSGDIDTAQFTEQDAAWLGDAYRITACITEPEKPSDLLEDLLPQMNAVSWWDPVAQKQKLKVLLPEKVTVPILDETANLIDGTVEVTSLDELRITQCAIFFGLRDATANLSEAPNFLQGEAAIDSDAEGPNEHDDVKPLIVYSRWFGLENAVALKAWAQRKLIARRDSPKRLTFALDPKDSVSLAQVVDVSTSQIVDAEGRVSPARMIVTKVLNEGHRLAVTARSFPFTKRYGYIAPNGTADYPTDQVYAHISDNSGLMGNGDGGYLII